MGSLPLGQTVGPAVLNTGFKARKMGYSVQEKISPPLPPPPLIELENRDKTKIHFYSPLPNGRPREIPLTGKILTPLCANIISTRVIKPAK